MKYTDLVQRDASHVMIFGDSKTGKSTLASELAYSFKLIWISMDGGHRVLSKLSAEAQDNIDIIVLPDTRDFPVAIDTCRKLVKGKPVTLCNNHGMVDCRVCKQHNQPFSSYEFGTLGLDTIVVWDHLSTLTDSCISLITKGKPIDYKLQLDDYGSLKFHMSEFLRDIQMAPYNTVCIAQAMEATMEDKTKKITPAVGSSEFGKLVGQYFDHIVFTKISSRMHRAGSATTYETSVITGSRTDVAIENLPKPTLIPFFDGSVAAGKKAEEVKKVSNTLADAALKAAAFASPPMAAQLIELSASDRARQLLAARKK
jgi:hypothetical protein